MYSNYIIVILSLLLIFSCIYSVFLLKKIKSKPAQAMSSDAKDLLRHIMSGTAIIQLSVIDPGDILIRSPRY